MSIGYSRRLVDTVKRMSKKYPDKLGMQLASLCIKHDVPVAEVAEYLGITRQAVHAWFAYKSDVSVAKAEMVAALIKKLKTHYEPETDHDHSSDEVAHTD